MSLEDRIKKRILDMQSCDKNGLILDLVEILYRNPDTGRIDRRNEWSQSTIERIADRLDTDLHARD
ncbi:hypothetical protein OpiT1DRAFT_05656 [Opitutaceae bacterium TAV1]|nr:hypothetical protein OpiT1DRAFT_05656 [Opitutaceae bacterium TAV1]